MVARCGRYEVFACTGTVCGQSAGGCVVKAEFSGFQTGALYRGSHFDWALVVRVHVHSYLFAKIFIGVTRSSGWQPPGMRRTESVGCAIVWG